jgi:aspartate aminotransferase
VIVAAGIEQGFKLKPEQLERAITAKTRMFVINSPSNPTGVAYTRAELEALGAVLRRHPQVLIATDDMYEHILWAQEPFSNVVSVCPDLQERAVVLNGVSKAYAMTGWRIGYCAGPKALITAMKNVQSQSTSNPTSIAQVAAEAALSGDQSCIAPMVKAFHERHDHVVARLNRIRGVRCLPAQGAFYAFPDFNPALAESRLPTDVALAEHLLSEAGVALVPGSAFGAPGHLRLSYATSLATLDKALDRIEKLLGRA